MDYEIKKLEEQTFDLLIPLMQDCFGMDVKLEYFRWKYLQNPAGIVEGYYAAHKTTNEVAAYYGVIPQRFLINGEKQKWFQSCDTMTHSKHRRKGLFQLLANHCYSELSHSNDLVITGFGGTESTPGFIKFGWKHLFNIRNYFHPALASRLFIGLSTNSVQQLSISNELEQILTLKSTSNKISLYLDIDTLKWRLSNPLREYKIIGIRKDEQTELEAFLIYYINNNKAIILDTEYTTTKDLNRLLKKVTTSEKIAGLLYFGQEESYTTKKLINSIFFHNPLKKGLLSQTAPFITYISKRKDSNLIESAENWNITPIYHDSI